MAPYNSLIPELTWSTDTVINCYTQFFAKDAIKQAIETCKVAQKVDIPERRRGSHPASSFLSDILELLCGLTGKEDLPIFAILDPSDLSSFPTNPHKIVASSLKECVRMLFFCRKTGNILSSDNLRLQFNIYMSPSQNKTRPCWFTKVSWDQIDVSSFQYTLDSLLIKIEIPFHLLSASLKGNPLDLDCFLAELTHSLKVASSVSVPSIRIKIGTQKRVGKKMMRCKMPSTVISLGF